ncbi:ComF family protein [uncultured Clostridium sp.]|uniref:ComF family protein n=1 Tax=Clostridium sp. TaxID=1506 RepID=UPI0025E5E670|nr:ComF family protein [uncultured Clostridium sp.]
MGEAIFKIISKILSLDSFNKVILKIYNEILDIIYPAEEKCITCRIDGFIGLCPCCKNSINRANIEKDSLSYGFYGGIIKILILKFKYESNFTAGYVLSNFLIEMIKEQEINGDVICYVPMSRKAKKKRGFNQCEIMAKNVGYKLNIPVSNCIKKIKDTREQKTLTKEERIINLKGAFKISSINEIKNKNIILIDDVMTTGATISECKYILKKSGAKQIIVLTIAKSNI